MRWVTATEYKKNALKLLEEVHRTGEAVGITKRGQPYARLTPEGPSLVFGRFAGTIVLTDDLDGLIIPESDYTSPW